MDVKQFCDKQISEIGGQLAKLDQSIYESHNKILEETKEKVRTWDESIKALETEEERLRGTLLNVMNRIEVLTEENAKLKNTLKNIENISTEVEKENLSKNTKFIHFTQRKSKALGKLSPKDELYMDSIVKKLKAYKTMTGIYWDYLSCEENILCGFAHNPSANKVKVFKLCTNNLSQEQITEKLWSYIKYVNGYDVQI